MDCAPWRVSYTEVRVSAEDRPPRPHRRARAGDLTSAPDLKLPDLDIPAIERLITRGVPVAQHDPVDVLAIARRAEILDVDAVVEGAGAVDGRLAKDGRLSSVGTADD